jgi:hypothetical protein
MSLLIIGNRCDLNCTTMHSGESFSQLDRVFSTADVLSDPGAAGHPADDPGGAVPVQALPVRGDEQRPTGALADRQFDRAGGARG